MALLATCSWRKSSRSASDGCKREWNSDTLKTLGKPAGHESLRKDDKMQRHLKEIHASLSGISLEVRFSSPVSAQNEPESFEALSNKKTTTQRSASFQKSIISPHTAERVGCDSHFCALASPTAASARCVYSHQSLQASRRTTSTDSINPTDTSPTYSRL